ncbi:Concanavalin A-like lectin/glucanases superfamily [Kalmanozyma brasiliensis GHG001]|uniref:GH16 domain-containing protein n=1 Tax=Kalmanozyma brasiliensis (strain GHG001) TaxID=1365824 RepID=V5GFF9_KALBG|nr:Concanavalin A-like lectin/glucanases superfamily [Kalmanozyma brasiliensis GHG001]EST04752.1 Concanavalin A-like lectin/glucanases superfamily [Kalmanozyma brasiliensis GHG001]
MIATSSRLLAATATLATLILPTRAANWTRSASIQGSDFFTTFDWFTDKDPTNGLVNYQSLSSAQSQNLSFVDGEGHFVMAVSTTPVALEGRNSVRITSKQSYSDGVYVANVTHVPLGCATWPAFWTVTENLSSWPVGGEIDIMENANDEYNGNLVSAHTSSVCTIPSSNAGETGVVAYTNCSAYAPTNPGCRVEANGTSTPTWGKALNRAGGGIIAMERSFGTTGKGVRVWYFPNSSPSSLPSDLASSSTQVNTDNWGTPNAYLPITDCSSDFGPHKIIFDITLCGDWAGNSYNQSGCNAQYPACSYQVGYNGSSFNQSYWEVESLRLFTEGGGDANAGNSARTAVSQQSQSDARRGLMVGEPVALGAVGWAAMVLAAAL